MTERNGTTAQNTYGDVLDQFSKAVLEEASAWMKDHWHEYATIDEDGLTITTKGMPAPVRALVRAGAGAWPNLTDEEMIEWLGADPDRRDELMAIAAGRSS